MQNGTWHFSSVAQSRLNLADPMDYSMPGFPVHHQLPEVDQIHVHQFGDALNHVILCCPLLLLASIFPSIMVFSNESCLALRKHLKHGTHYDFTSVDTKLFTLAFQFPALKQIPLHI